MAIDSQTRFTFSQDTELLDFLESMETRVSDFSPVMREGSLLMVSDVKDRITSRDGGKWREHAESTKERSRRGGRPWNRRGDHPLLQLSGDLLASILPGWTENIALAYTRDPVAHLQELGTERHAIGGEGVNLYQERANGRTMRRSRSEVRSMRRSLTSSEHTPLREFMYERQETRDAIYLMILSHALGEQTSQAA